MTSRAQYSTRLPAAGLLAFFAAIVLAGPANAKPSPVKHPEQHNVLISASPEGAGELIGVYVPNVLALPVVQQPAGLPGYVSSDEHVLTQFGMAWNYGNVGLLAHNYLAGRLYSQLEEGSQVFLVYDDGHVEGFVVGRILKFQALDPFNPRSEFVDTVTQSHLSAEDLFRLVYRGSPHVVFQTCIESNGNPSWGRLFVIAEPAEISVNFNDSHFKPVLLDGGWGTKR